MHKCTSIQNLVTAQYFTYDGGNYQAKSLDRTGETGMYKDGECIGYIHPSSRKQFKVLHRSKGILWECKIPYSSVLCSEQDKLPQRL